MKTGVDFPAPPAPPSGDGGGSGRGWVRLVRAANDIDAHLLVGRMSEAGIETRLLKDRAAPGSWLYGGSNPWAPVTVLVPRRQYDDARLVLAEIAFDAPAAAAPDAPAEEGRSVLVWWVAAVALGVVLTLIGLGRAAQTLRADAACASSVACDIAR